MCEGIQFKVYNTFKVFDFDFVKLVFKYMTEKSVGKLYNHNIKFFSIITQLQMIKYFFVNNSFCFQHFLNLHYKKGSLRLKNIFENN